MRMEVSVCDIKVYLLRWRCHIFSMLVKDTVKYSIYYAQQNIPQYVRSWTPLRRLKRPVDESCVLKKTCSKKQLRLKNSLPGPSSPAGSGIEGSILSCFFPGCFEYPGQRKIDFITYTDLNSCDVHILEGLPEIDRVSWLLRLQGFRSSLVWDFVGGT